MVDSGYMELVNTKGFKYLDERISYNKSSTGDKEIEYWITCAKGSFN